MFHFFICAHIHLSNSSLKSYTFFSHTPGYALGYTFAKYLKYYKTVHRNTYPKANKEYITIIEKYRRDRTKL